MRVMASSRCVVRYDDHIAPGTLGIAREGHLTTWCVEVELPQSVDIRPGGVDVAMWDRRIKIRTSGTVTGWRVAEREIPTSDGWRRFEPGAATIEIRGDAPLDLRDHDWSRTDHLDPCAYHEIVDELWHMLRSVGMLGPEVRVS